MNRFSIDLPLPPSQNTLFANSSNRSGKGRFKTKQYKEWELEADATLINVTHLPSIEGDYCVDLHVPAKMRGDVDNRPKAVLDWMVSRGLTPDDANAWSVQSTRDELIEKGTCNVTVWEVKR